MKWSVWLSVHLTCPLLPAVWKGRGFYVQVLTVKMLSAGSYDKVAVTGDENKFFV